MAGWNIRRRVFVIVVADGILLQVSRKSNDKR